MEYDTPAWHTHRDSKLADWVGNPAAVKFIQDVGVIAETWDDLIDGDKPVGPDDINRAFLLALVELPSNPFYDAHRHSLLPMLLAGANAWVDSTTYERSTDLSQKAYAYVLRDWYVEIVLLVIALTKGVPAMRAVSMDVRAFFTHDAESFQDYARGLL